MGYLDKRVLLFPILILLFFPIVNTALADYYYTFNGLYSEDGTYSGSTYCTVYFQNGTSTEILVERDDGYGMHFDGNNDRVDVADTYRLDVENRNFSVEFWIRTDSAGTGLRIAEKVVWAATWDGWAITNVANGVQFFIGNGTDLVTSYTSYVINDNVDWHHVAVTVDRTGDQCIYVDGALKANDDITTFAGQNITSGTNFHLMYRIQGGQYLHGELDEFRFYNRTLTSTEILYNYNNGAGLYYPQSTSNLDIWWHMDEGAGNPSSTSPADIDGTNNGATWVTGHVPYITQVTYSEVPVGFEWNVTGVTVPRYFIPTGATSEDFYLYDLEATGSSYTFTIYDYAGVFPAYLETHRHVNNTKTTIERRTVSKTQNQVPMVMVTGATYFIQVRGSDDTIYDFGMFVPGSNTATFTLTEVAFSQLAQLTYRYFTVESTRSATMTTITTNFADNDDNSDVSFFDVEIYYRNRTLAWESNVTSPGASASIIWNSADNETAYIVDVELTNSYYGTLQYSKALSGATSFTSAPDLGILGTFGGVTTSNLLGVGLIFAVALLSSTLVVPLGAFLVVVTAASLVYLGFISISSTILYACMGLAILLGIGWVRRR